MKLEEFLKRGQRDDLARQVGVRPEYLSRIRSGKLAASFELALRISAATKGQVSVEELMRSATPFPCAARLRECDPIPTEEQIAELEWRQDAQLLGEDPDAAPDGLRTRRNPAEPLPPRQRELLTAVRTAAGDPAALALLEALVKNLKE